MKLKRRNNEGRQKENDRGRGNIKGKKAMIKIVAVKERKHLRKLGDDNYLEKRRQKTFMK